MQFCSCFNSLNFQKSLLYQFCTTSLNSKISLCKSNLRLSWVAILCDQIASITGEHDVVYLSKRTTTHLNLFIDVNKMVYYILSYISTCFFCLCNNICKVLP